MKIYNIIGIDPFHYEEIKFDTFVRWISSNSNTAKEYQLCLINRSLRNYFMSELKSLEIRFIAHLQMFKKPINPQQRLELYFDYLDRFKVVFPKALKPKVTTKHKINYAYN